LCQLHLGFCLGGFCVGGEDVEDEVGTT
jgi:hypothetical protein